MQNLEDNKSAVEKMIEELESSVITMENYASYIQKVQSASQVIAVTLDNIITGYKSHMKRYKEKTGEANTKRSEEEGFVKLEVINIVFDMNESLKDAYSWKSLEVQLFNVIYEKIVAVLGSVSAFEVKKETLKEMREMETKRNTMFLETVQSKNALIEEIINNKLKTIDDKIINAFKFAQDQATQERKVMFDAFASLMNSSVEERKELQKKFDDLISKSNKLKDSVMKEIEPMKITKQKVKEELPTIDDDDEDPFADDDDTDLED